MIKSKRVERVAILIQPYLIGYISKFITKSINPQLFMNSEKYMVYSRYTQIIFLVMLISLYTMIGYAAYLTLTLAPLNKRSKDIKRRALLFNQVGLFLNFSWSILYFGLNMVGVSFLICLALLLISITTLYYYFRLLKLAGYLLIPYILWLSLALYWNYISFSNILT